MILGCCLFEVYLTLSIIVLYFLELSWYIFLPSAILSETFISDIITNFIPRLLIEFGHHWIETKSIQNCLRNVCNY